MRASVAVVCLLFAAACGKTTSLVDGATGDGKGADAASTADADPHGVVKVIVLSASGDGTPVVGQTVLFIEPNGTIEAETPTDSNGTASASVLPGASVATFYGQTTLQHNNELITGVKPGDTITIGAKTTGAAAGTFGVTITPVFLSRSYDIYGPCGSVNVPDPGSGATTASGSLAMTDDCKRANMDLVAVLNNNDGIPSSYVEQPNVAFTDGGSATMPSTWIPLQANTTTYQNLPANTNRVGFELHVPDIKGYASSQFQYTGGSATLNTTTPVAASSLDIVTIGTGGGTQVIYTQNTGTPAAYTFDFSTGLLPWVSAPSLDLTTGAITNTVSATGGDVFNTEVEYNRIVTAGTQYIFWDIWAATSGNVQLPTLPTDLMADAPLATDSIDFQWAGMIDVDAVTSYDQIRGNLFGGLAAYYNGRGTSGSLHLSDSDIQNAGIAPPPRRPRRVPSWIPHPPVAAHRSR